MVRMVYARDCGERGAQTRLRRRGAALGVLIAALVALGAIGACSAPSLPPPRAGVGVVPAALGPGDVFTVKVYDEKDLSGTYRVASDGTIIFPLIGDVRVDGLTASQISKLLTKKLGRYLKQPNVSIFVNEFNSKKVYVFGKVQRPGTFPYEDRMNIIQAITLAGGFGKLANEKTTYVTRVENGHEKRFQVSINDISEGRSPNFYLRPGDIVYVPESMF